MKKTVQTDLADTAPGEVATALLDSHGPLISVQAAGRQWQLERAANLEELWQAMTEDQQSFEDERLPYWTELWPSSLVLAGWLAGQKKVLADRPCLDMGCGLGLTAMVCQWLGARVSAMDYEPEALRYAALNAQRNHVPQPSWLLMDWRRPALQAGSMAYIWGGDIMYEKRFVSPVLRFLGHALAPGGVAWVAEPGRSVYEAFLHALYGSGWQGRRVHSGQVRVVYDSPVPVTVHIWELTRRA